MSRSPSAETRCDTPARRNPVTKTGGASGALLGNELGKAASHADPEGTVTILKGDEYRAAAGHRRWRNAGRVGPGIDPVESVAAAGVNVTAGVSRKDRDVIA